MNLRTINLMAVGGIITSIIGVIGIMVILYKGMLDYAGFFAVLTIMGLSMLSISFVLGD